ncbi:MAG: ATP-binding protein [Erysipelotrichaceae bacterium]|nr:ATP-binding protein [Erysipelotrichaceae bacterium]
MIERNRYLDQLIRNKDNGFPKVITGVRRCGKSFLIKEIYANYLKESGIKEESILIIELDNDANVIYRNPIELGKYVRSFCNGKEKCYVFIDEIQLVDTIINPIYTNGKYVLAKKNDENTISFVETVLGLSREKNIDLYVTGSNSKMLSSDIVTEFRDKATNISLYPLSFAEFYKYKGGSATDDLYEFMQYGGMPLAVLKEKEDRKDYLKNLFKMVYFADIIEHNRLNKSESLDELCNIVSSCTGDLLNSQKIADTYKSVKHETIDKETVEKYLGYFIDAFMIRQAGRYDVKGRKEIGALRKYYFTDTGLRNARLNFAYSDDGQMLENVIYNELIFNGYTVNIGTYERVEKDENGKSIKVNYEIDFLAERNNRKYYIQVTDNLNSEETRKREIKPYIGLNDQIQKIIVINKPIDETRTEEGYTIISAADFMLRFII